MKGWGAVAHRLLPAVALAVFALLWAAASASAAPTWLAPTNLSEGGLSGEHAQVAVDPQGDAVAVWQRNDGSGTIVQAASRGAGGAWSAPVDLSTPGQNAGSPRVALDAEGDAVVVWQCFDGSDEVVQAASRGAGGAWSAPVDLSASGQNAYNPEIALDAKGDAVAVWERYDGTDWIIQGASSPALGAWSAPVNLSASGEDAEDPQVALDPQGDAVATWERYDGTDEIIQAASRGAGGVWSAPVDLSAPGQSAYYTRVALGAGGNAVVVWERLDGANWVVQAASGEAGVWSAPVDLSAPGQNAYNPEIALDAKGDAVAVWERNTDKIIQAASREAGGAWSAPADLSAPAERVEDANVALDAGGDAIAIWGRYDNTDEIVQAAAYDAAGPQLRGLVVPAAGTVGQPLTFSVSPLDVFSAVGATSWSFGDGATAPGTAATHAYGNAGTYTVTVTSADALGNTSTATGTVTVAAPPVITPPRAALARAAARAQVKNGRALLKLTCPASGPCKGRVAIETRVKKASAKGHGAKKKGQARSVRIGAASFTLAAGAHSTVRAKLDAKGLALLKASGKRGLKARVGGQGIKSGPLVLKATPPRHRAHRHT